MIKSPKQTNKQTNNAKTILLKNPEHLFVISLGKPGVSPPCLNGIWLEHSIDTTASTGRKIRTVIGLKAV